MRTAVSLDQDVHDFAQAYANRRGISLSAAISELIRHVKNTSGPEGLSPRLKTSPHGYLVIASTGDVITSEMVKEADSEIMAR